MYWLSHFLQRFAENFDGLIDLLFGDDQRRLEANDIAVATDTNEHAVLEAIVAARFCFG